IAALAAGGVYLGLKKVLARALATHTTRGAAAMVQSTERPPSELRDQVTSPGGTTLAGLEALRRGGLESALRQAVAAATKRSKELGQ
ncbi:MAG: pyrroline-5-carboxylate reductase dimerization domain-containing protein, partial [Planctomycetota bacterium]